VLPMRDFLSAAYSPHGPACTTCEVARDGICSALDDAALAALRRISRRKLLPAGRVIFNEGDDAGTCFSIMSGIVKLVKTLSGGGQHIIGLIHHPNFVGQSLNRRHAYRAESLTEVELCIYPQTAFEAFRQDHIGFDRKIFENTSRELENCRDMILLLGRKCSYERVAGFLLTMANRISQPSGLKPNTARFELPLTRAEIADYLGLTLETVSRQFSKLKQQRLAEWSSRREIAIPDMELLAATAGLESCCEASDEPGNRPVPGSRGWVHGPVLVHSLSVPQAKTAS